MTETAIIIPPAIAGRIPGRPAIDWPTMGVAALTYASFLVLTWNYTWLAWWIIWPLGAITVTLQGSLQHEATHGYPTKWEWVNSWIVGWALWLWLPYLDYRNTHRIHHIDSRLTDPRLDPESNYLTPEMIDRMSPAHLLLRKAIATLGGRMILGPAYFAFLAWQRGMKGIVAGDPAAIKAWSWHLAASALVLYWAIGVCGIPLWAYVLFFAYPGTSLTVLRSFAEHRAIEDAEQRTVMCEAGWFWSALFLNNNLHKAHHDAPGLVWHQRPAKYRRERDRLLALNGGYRFPGYGVQFARYFFRAKEPLRHPFAHGTERSIPGAY